MADQVILQIAKTLDNDDNAVSLAKAISQLGDHQPGKADLVSKLSALRGKAQTVMMHRDKRIAHSDRSVALKKRVLAPVTQKEIDGLLSDLAKLIDEIWRAHGRGQLVVDHSGVAAAIEDMQIAEFYKLLRWGLERRAAKGDDD